MREPSNADVDSVLDHGGFNMRCRISNHREVVATIPVEKRAKSVVDLDLDQDVMPIERALAVSWCVKSDRFRVYVDVQKRPPPRREILSIVSSVYDPLGFLTPFVLRAKGLLQEITRLQLGWDATIPDGLLNQWAFLAA
ncbi:PREDICTED: uncharacterized protein LOC106808632 [Priapulus caudatus]|uniref:Uncharacterized protein LOC106808632 n=1 Tax=Priapulus caudatus TaxID=37621 RepID=A0ABM1E433_PRICU|nr:PREDICTED: uncharacterized protein LOC106808632 [Priapulus caudatus]